MPTFKQFLKEHDYNSDVFDDELEASELANANNDMYNLIKAYFAKNDNNGKKSMFAFGSDLAEAYAKFITEEFVAEDAFKNDDVKLKYKNAVRDKIAEALSIKFKTLFEAAGQTADEIRLTLPLG